MPELDDQVREALAAAITPVVEAHGGPQAVAALVGVHRSRVYQWMKGVVPLDRVGHIAQKLDVEITVTFRPDRTVEANTKEPPPEWAEALVERIASRIETMISGDGATDGRKSLTDRVADRLEARLEAPQSLTDEAPVEESEASPAGERKAQRRKR